MSATAATAEPKNSKPAKATKETAVMPSENVEAYTKAVAETAALIVGLTEEVMSPDWDAKVAAVSAENQAADEAAEKTSDEPKVVQATPDKPAAATPKPVPVKAKPTPQLAPDITPERAFDILKNIREARHEADVLAKMMGYKNQEYKDAKKAAEGADEKVRRLEREIEAGHFPLLDAAAKIVASKDEPKVADEPWRSVRLDTLALSPAIIKALAEAKIVTIGDVAKHTGADKSLASIKGIGSEKAERISNVLMKYHDDRIASERAAASKPAASVDGGAAEILSGSDSKPDALPNVPPIDWRTIKLSAVLGKHLAIRDVLANRYKLATLGEIADYLKDNAIGDMETLGDDEIDTLAEVLDRKRRDSDGFAAAVTREMLGFEPEPEPKPAKKTRKAAATAAEGSVAASA